MKKAPAIIIFDFDGTIADSMKLVQSIYNSIAPKFGCRLIQNEEWELLRKRRPQEFFREYGMNLSKMARFALRVRKEIKKRITEIQPFEGIDTIVEKLTADGYRLGIISSNAVENVRSFLTAQSLVTHFDFIWSGRNLFGKEHVIRKCLRKRRITYDYVAYVGDETRDIEAVRKVGIPMIAVTWGYNDRELLEKMNPDALVETPVELYSWIHTYFGTKMPRMDVTIQ